MPHLPQGFGFGGCLDAQLRDADRLGDVAVTRVGTDDDGILISTWQLVLELLLRLTVPHSIAKRVSAAEARPFGVGGDAAWRGLPGFRRDALHAGLPGRASRRSTCRGAGGHRVMAAPQSSGPGLTKSRGAA